mmetsp:Transcript_14083/g.30588  ORF Transcript_14083/g.30588 Transcript_14083/m.30588 type:complete len:104 (+) Transcript_14083:63-374(+)
MLKRCFCGEGRGLLLSRNDDNDAPRRLKPFDDRRNRNRERCVGRFKIEMCHEESRVTRDEMGAASSKMQESPIQVKTTNRCRTCRGSFYYPALLTAVDARKDE